MNETGDNHDCDVCGDVFSEDELVIAITPNNWGDWNLCIICESKYKDG